MTESERAALRELTDSEGWKLVIAYLTTQDDRITGAIKHDLMSMNWAEREKWFAYYSGQMSVITGLQRYVEQSLGKADMLEKIKRFKFGRSLD